MVRVPPVLKDYMEVHPGIIGQGPEEIFKYGNPEVLYLGASFREADLIYQIRPSAEINGYLGKAFIHGSQGFTVPPDLHFFTEGLLDRLPQYNAQVLY